MGNIMRQNKERRLQDICELDFSLPGDRRPKRLMILLGMTCTAFALIAATTVLELRGRDEPVARAEQTPLKLAGPQPADCAQGLQTLASQSTVHFDVDSAQLTADDLRQTRKLFDAAQGCPGVTLQVWGHTDASGDDVTNLALSHQRARNLLVAIETMGFDTDRIEVLAAGATQPIAEGDTDDELDRRVEFVVVPVED